jgi:hypothetical protein
MRVRFVLSLFYLLLITSTISGCTSQSVQLDSPMLSSKEAISIAQQHAALSPINRDEGIASRSSQMQGNRGWRATYSGNGKWSVEFGRYRWTVFEAQQTALFLGSY